MAYITGFFGSSKSFMKPFVCHYLPIRLTQVPAFGAFFTIIMVIMIKKCDNKNNGNNKLPLCTLVHSLLFMQQCQSKAKCLFLFSVHINEASTAIKFVAQRP